MTDETRSVEIPEEAVAKAAWVFAEHRSRAWLTYSDETRAQLAESWQPTTRAALEAALPYLAPAGDGGLREALNKLVQEWQYTGEPVDMTRTDVVMDDCADELKRVLAAHPAAPAVPQPVDREALTREQIKQALCSADGPIDTRSADVRSVVLEQTYGKYADAVLAVLAGEQEQVDK